MHPGDLAEDLAIEVLELVSSSVGTRISIGQDVLLDITETSKKCHSGCAIYQQIGKCIMPKEGVFGKVISGGLIRTGDRISVCRMGDASGQHKED